MKRRKTGGRSAGTPNKSMMPLKEIADQLGVDPFKILLYFAKNDWKSLGYDGPTKLIPTKKGAIEVDTISTDQRLKAASEACSYIYPKRKAVEHKIDKDTSSQVIEVKWADESSDQNEASNDPSKENL